MIVLDWLIPSMRKLADAGVDSPRRDGLVLLEDLLNKDRSWIISHAEFELSNKQIKHLDSQIKRRISREPLAYIRGKAWFYGRFFEVSKSVMVPRPESESFIELLKQIKPASIADIGTGSGCLAVTAKLEFPEAEVTAVDIDGQALKIAQKNAKTHDVDIKFIQGSLMEPLKNMPAAIIANLPYVPDGLITSEEINYEPKTALFSGQYGLDHYRKFWAQTGKLNEKALYILIESLENQHEILTKLAEDTGYELVKTAILVQLYKRI